jgi:hypothetical protein
MRLFHQHKFEVSRSQHSLDSIQEVDKSLRRAETEFVVEVLWKKALWTGSESVTHVFRQPGQGIALTKL